MAQKIKPQKTFHIKGKKESRKWRSGYAIYVSGVIFQGFHELTLRTSPKAFFYLEINRCFAPPKTKKECQQHTVTIWSFLVLYQWPFYRFTHWNFNDVGNSVEKVQLLNNVKTVVKFCPVTLSVQTEQAQLIDTIKYLATALWYHARNKDSSCHAIHWFTVIYWLLVFFPFDISMLMINITVFCEDAHPSSSTFVFVWLNLAKLGSSIIIRKHSFLEWICSKTQVFTIQYVSLMTVNNTMAHSHVSVQIFLFLFRIWLPCYLQQIDNLPLMRQSEINTTPFIT